MLRINEVTLNGKSPSSRKGDYFRIYNNETKRTSYYRRSERSPTRETALVSYRKRHRMPEVRREEITGNALRLHVKIDYSSDRPNHDFFLHDSYIDDYMREGESVDDATERMFSDFKNALRITHGNSTLITGLNHVIEKDNSRYVNGVERLRGSVGKNNIVINYGYKFGRTHERIVTSKRSIDKEEAQQKKVLDRYRTPSDVEYP